jgi:hypothetical protein
MSAREAIQGMDVQLLFSRGSQNRAALPAAPNRSEGRSYAHR